MWTSENATSTAAVITIEPGAVDAIPKQNVSVPGTMTALGSRFLILSVGTSVNRVRRGQSVVPRPFRL